ncbi:hypothetical protein LEP1GSC074_0077 [Leptospira noguchii str. Hook]|uniref:Uncharacterized protein n=1 Tax=Leptospira noguchii serovar Autumnalis str. ZUN142 TaxID=1085540 RepID=M6UX06_9LEPT|nr:hypothetical protein LEP1GSC041_4151 [Leptospira noguchii str. 2006001870]EMO41848.1 hypothetical protein LEP1GSC186_1879 [Leptospira noguchii serovar Autumnalis str. ZUN142]EMS87694.1 hypothetical protein LEP1GSC074_0077 [Leptospira noguchii str. Hook]
MKKNFLKVILELVRKIALVVVPTFLDFICKILVRVSSYI